MADQPDRLFSGGSLSGSPTNAADAVAAGRGRNGGGRRRGGRNGGGIEVNLQSLFDRLPPHAIEAEMHLLGAMIIDHRIIGEVVEVVRTADDFYKASHSAIFQALVDLYNDRNAGDITLLYQLLVDRGQIAEVGGEDYLEELAESTPIVENALQHAREVANKASLRRLIAAAGEVLYHAYTSPEDPRQVLDAAERAIFSVVERSESRKAEALADLLIETMAAIESRSQSGMITGLATGYREFDEQTSGLQPGDMVILAARPSMGKCLTADSEIVLADGSLVTIEEMVRNQRADRLLTLTDRWRLEWTTPGAFVDDGVKPVFRVRTRLGREICSTAAHPFRTLRAWQPLHELSVGDRIAVPRRIGVFGTRGLGASRVKMLAYLLGDGGLTNANPRFTNADERIVADFVGAAEAFAGVQVHAYCDGLRTPSYTISTSADAALEARRGFACELDAALAHSPRSARRIALEAGLHPSSITQWRQALAMPTEASLRRLASALQMDPDELTDGVSDVDVVRRNSPNTLTRWLESLGVMGAGAREKFIPAAVFTLPRNEVALFLNRLFACDGWATLLASDQAQIGFTSASERLARQVQHLLLRFGVIGSLRHRRVKYQGGVRPAWQIDITHADSILTFAEEIGIFSKEEAVDRVRTAVQRKRRQVNRDLIPVEIWQEVDGLRGDRTWADVSEAMGLGRGCNILVGRRALSRARVGAMAEALDADVLRDLATSDVYWDEIVEIEPLGERQVYDLTIPVTHNFVANDICVHNTAFAINMAENVALMGHGVLVFSMEMSKQQLAQRLLCSRSEVDSQKLRRNMIGKDDLRRLGRAVGELSEAPIFIDDTPGLSILEMRAKARRLFAQHKIKLIVIDYLQLMTGSTRESRQTEVAEISRGVKGLARELGVPVICLSQLNRAAENREDHRPRLSDLRESGSIEQDADVVMMLHREDYYRQKEEGFVPTNIAEVIIAKQRNGPTGTIKLTWVGSSMKFKDFADVTAPGGFGGGGGGGGGYADYGGGGGGGPSGWDPGYTDFGSADGAAYGDFNGGGGGAGGGGGFGGAMPSVDVPFDLGPSAPGSGGGGGGGATAGGSGAPTSAASAAFYGGGRPGRGGGGAGAGDGGVARGPQKPGARSGHGGGAVLGAGGSGPGEAGGGGAVNPPADDWSDWGSADDDSAPFPDDDIPA